MSSHLVVTVLVVAAVVVAFSWWTKQERDALYRLLRGQAEKRAGEAEPGTLLYYPKLSFTHMGVVFTASALLGGRRPDRRPATTYVKFSVSLRPGNDFRVRRKTKSLQTVLDGKLGGSPVRTGDPAFDESFRVKSANAQTALQFLTDDVQRCLLAFDETVDVRFAGSQCIVTVDGIVKSEAALDRMLDLAVLAHGALRDLASDSSGT